MSNPDQIEKELREYLEKEPNLRRADRIVYLMSIFNKHLSINNLDHMINKHDFHEIHSVSGSVYATQPTPMFISGRKVDTSELTCVATVESFISYLNKHHLLKKIVKFDYRD